MEINVGVIEAVGVVVTIAGGFLIFTLKYESRISKMETKIESFPTFESRLLNAEQDLQSMSLMKDIISEAGSDRVKKVFKEKEQ